jgi:ribonucleoside-diphosphate reductase alpha chain
MVFNLSISQLKKHYIELYQNSPDYQTFLKEIIIELSEGLHLDLELINKDLEDPALLATERLAIKNTILTCLERVFLPLAEAAAFKIDHPDWFILAGRLEIQRIKLQIPDTLKEAVGNIPQAFNKTEYDDLNYYDFCMNNAEALEALIVPERDYKFAFFGVRTLEKTYLLKIETEDGVQFYETPQRLYLRVASYLWYPHIPKIKDFYDIISQGIFTHATPTLANSGLRKGSLASCYLLSVQDDLKKIGDCMTQCMMISKHMGGVGFDSSNIRHSKIGLFGKSNGIVPMLKVLNNAMQYADQGGRRKGSATVFLQPWHVDFPDFLELKRQQGKEERRARDLFYAVWCCDLFMDRVSTDSTWSLFCPKKAPGLTEVYGEEFEKLYLEHEEKGIYERQVPARELWNELLKTQVETGMPFIGHKDTVNYVSNQKNIGIIRSSNLCMEINEVSDEHRVASCNLASIALNSFVKDKNYDFKALGETVRMCVRAINQVIDRTYYPLGETGPIKTTNIKYRPLGIGVQGLADTFMMMEHAWGSDEARNLNREIFACMYYHAVDESVEQAKKFGSYEGFVGSPASKGMLKPDLIALERARKIARNTGEDIYTLVGKIRDENLSNSYDWNSLRMKVVENGMRNSLLIALMPTASTAQILGNVEAFEPITKNIYSRTVLSGDHVVMNRHMVREFEKLGIWNRSVVNHIVKNEGSVQNIPESIVSEENLPRLKFLKDLYRTVFEIKQKIVVDYAIDRSFYVCQSQSLNIHIDDPTFQQLTSLHFHAWKNCLSTGMYYLRTSPAAEAVKFTVEGEIDVDNKMVVCSEDVCVMCSS